VHFTIPYAKWGNEEPECTVSRVNDSVEIELAGPGIVTDHAATARDSAQ
jgi:hypothetical protein